MAAPSPAPAAFTFCCAAYKKAAIEFGTDNEGYGRLIRNYDSGEFPRWIGYDLPQIEFCPWCGTALKALSFSS